MVDWFLRCEMMTNMIDLLFEDGKSFPCNSVHDIDETGDFY